MKIGEIITSNPLGLPEGENSKARYLQELEDWKNQGVAREERAEAVSDIKAFIDNPTETRLSFFNYHLTTVPPLDFIAERIEVFDLSDNQLQELPESLEKLHNLVSLNVSCNPYLKELPEWFGRELHNLVSLDVSCNRDLKEIPLSLLDSLNFKKLDSTRTEITKTLKELRQKRQEDRAEIAFHLLSGKIEHRLPESSVLKVDHFIKESSLYLEKLEDWKKEGVQGEGEDRAKAVSQIHAFINNPKKIRLSLEGLSLTTLPPLYFIEERITGLDLSDNQLQEFPEWLGRKLYKLASLDVSYNPNLKQIPTSLLDSPNFKQLKSVGTLITKSLQGLRGERVIVREL